MKPFPLQADIDGHRLVNDLIKNISRPIAFDAVMRVRTSTGIRPTDFFGHFFMSNTTDMEIASIGKQFLSKISESIFNYWVIIMTMCIRYLALR